MTYESTRSQDPTVGGKINLALERPQSALTEAQRLARGEAATAWAAEHVVREQFEDPLMPANPAAAMRAALQREFHF